GASVSEKKIKKKPGRDGGQGQCRFSLHGDSADSLGAPFPPNGRAENDKDERDQDEDHPTQTPQSVFVQTEGERLRNFWRDSDKLFATQQPVCARGNEIERLLVLGQRIVLNERRVAYHHHAR